MRVTTLKDMGNKIRCENCSYYTPYVATRKGILHSFSHGSCSIMKNKYRQRGEICSKHERKYD